MPELPEVETVRRGLEPVLRGRRLAHVSLSRPNLRFEFPKNFEARLKGQTVTSLSRRSKYLLIGLSGDQTLMVHLGMSGRFEVLPPPGEALPPGTPLELANYYHARDRRMGLSGGARGASGESEGDWPRDKHAHVRLVTDHGWTLDYVDPRRFGFMLLYDAQSLADEPMLAKLGPEPLSNDFSVLTLQEALAGRKSPIKTALLDQTVVAGLGNIYVCESLFRAGIAPERLAKDVREAELAALVVHIRTVLTEALEAGGSSLKDFAHADGELGYFQHRFSVYDREGDLCVRPGCGGTIVRQVQAGRSSFSCPKCQS